MIKDIKGYYFITDKKLSKAGNAKDVKDAIDAGAKIVQYREKDLATRALCEEAAEIRKLCWKTLFIVNDRVDVAMAIDADGVHIGQDDIMTDVLGDLICL